MHGKNTIIKLDNAGGVLTDISAYCDNVDFPGLSAETSDNSGFGATSKTFVAGQKSGTFSASGPWSATPDAILEGAVGESRSFAYTPGGGSVVYSGEAICTSYQVSSSKDSPVTWSASFQITGDVTRT